MRSSAALHASFPSSRSFAVIRIGRGLWLALRLALRLALHGLKRSNGGRRGSRGRRLGKFEAILILLMRWRCNEGDGSCVGARQVVVPEGERERHDKGRRRHAA